MESRVVVVLEPRMDAPVRTKAVLVDPNSGRVLWTNDPSQSDEDALAGAPETILSIPDARALSTAIDSAAAGTDSHFEFDLVSIGRGAMTVATSAYGLPDGTVLVLSERTWRAREDTGERTARGDARRGRKR